MRRKVPQDPNSTNSYTVAWICALEEEYVCACRMLDEEFTGAEVTEENDDNTYVYGRIARHYLVIGCLPAGRYGTNSAARVARDMVRTFPNLRFALMVGIGGGVPSARNDIRLGDVVVSQPNNMCGGVIQYDLGKKLQNGRFQRVSQLNGPPEKLLGVIQELRRLYSDKRRPDRIAEHLQRMNDMEEFQRPAVDQLYKADYEHVDGIDCGQCDFHSVVQRPERRSCRVIHVHYGSIASGNSLLKDAIQRDLYANDPELNVLCFEMESAGLMNNLPCLVIRGICDYCDSHKNDAWHNYAALTAAAYARELLLLLQPHRVSAMPYWDGQVALELSKVGQELVSLNNNQRTVEMKVDSLDEKVDGANLSVAKGAAFDCYDNQHSECLPGTRVELLGDIEDWSESPTGKCIFWLNGMAGTGKSTISRTIAALLNKKGLLGASFFFKRGEQDRGTAKQLFPTLAKQLLARIPHMSTEVRRSIENDPDISEKGLREQFKRLILDPLFQITHDQAEIQVRVIVIDAIDECENEDDIQAILQLLPQAQNFPSVRLRFLLTSRPELPIRLGFKGITGDHQDLVLHEIPSSIIERDIKIYFEERFLQLRKKRSLPSDWPGTKTIQDLSERAAPLFISAATLCRFICDNNWMPEKRLKVILEDKSTYVSKMDSTYVPVLNQLLTGQDEWEARQLIQEFKDIVGVIILVFTPLSITALSRLLRIEIDDIQNRLDHLHSVLSIPGDLVTPVRPLHLSFRDFLLDPRQKSNSPFWIDQKEVHQTLTVQCLKVMGQNLRKNIYNLPNDSTQRSEINIDSLDHFLPSELQYACRYWAQHLVQSMEPTAQLAKAISFLKLHFLHWVEVMSLLGIVSEVVATIHLLQSIAQESEISRYLHDMRRFILKNRHIADAAPLQLYSSCLVFAPATAIVRKQFCAELPSWICKFPKVEKNWNAELQALEGHLGPVVAVAFSPKSQVLATGSHDKTIRIWCTITGTLYQTIEVHSDWVRALAFSPNGQSLASGSCNTIKILNADTGTVQHEFYGHCGLVWAVEFSPDNRFVASGSVDCTAKLWNTASGVVQHTFNHTCPVQAVAFSPDGHVLATGSHDKTIKLWDTKSGALKRILKGHLNWIRAVAFSPDGQLLASGSHDGTIKLWTTATWTLKSTLIVKDPLQKTLDGHQNSVGAVAFSEDSQLLASGCHDGVIRLWDTGIGVLRQTLEGHAFSVWTVRFSVDGHLLASGSYDSTAKLWDISTGALQCNCANEEVAQQTRLNSHYGPVGVIEFSPDGRLLASGSIDGTVKLWSVATGALIQTLQGHSESIWASTFSPDGRSLASGSHDKTIKLWDISTGTGTLRHTLEGHSDSIRALAFSQDSQLLASSSADATIKLWDPVAGALKHTLTVEEVVTVMKFSNHCACLETNLGEIHIQSWYESTTSCATASSSTDSEILLEGHWLFLGGKKALWLPPEYRPTGSAIKGRSVALGHASGHVSLIEFST